MSLRSDLGKVKGLGSAKEGLGHWRLQRLTAIALVPLSLWFVFTLMGLVGAPHAVVVAWIGQLPVTVLHPPLLPCCIIAANLRAGLYSPPPVMPAYFPVPPMKLHLPAPFTPV